MCSTGLSGYEDRNRKGNDCKMKQQIYNPYLPLENYIPDGEPKRLAPGQFDAIGSQWEGHALKVMC